MVNSKKHSYFGKWWLPDSPEYTISGTLTIDELGKATFFTIEEFEKTEATENLNLRVQYNELFGIATSVDDNNDHSIKLYGLKKIEFSTSVLTKSRYHIEKVLIGNVNIKEKGDRFNTIMLFSQSWNWWIRTKGVKIRDVKSQKKLGFSTTYTQPDSVTLYSDSDLHIYVYFRGNIETSVVHGFKIHEEPFLNIESKNGFNLKEAHKIKANIERYFMTIWEYPHSFEVFEIRSNDNTHFDVINSPIRNPSSNIHGRIEFNNFIKTSQTTFSNWFRISKEIENLMNTFFFAYSSENMDIHNRFLNYIFSLELYHRKRVKDKRSLKIKDQNMYAKAMAEVKGGTASWLEKVLSIDREIPLSDRITELLEMLVNKEKIELTNTLIKRTKSTRHYLVHLDEQYKKDCFTAMELLNINDILTLLFLRLIKQELI